jgi:hypothetical protein
MLWSDAAWGWQLINNVSKGKLLPSSVRQVVTAVRTYLLTIYQCALYFSRSQQTNSVAWVLERSIPTERPSLVGEVSANFFRIECHVVSVTDPYGRILGFLDRSSYSFFQVAPQLYPQGWVDPVPDPLLLRKFGISGNRSWASGSVARNSDH